MTIRGKSELTCQAFLDVHTIIVCEKYGVEGGGTGAEVAAGLSEAVQVAAT